jgi:[acyl-carrier-protein] S-malonyltransferase
MTVVNLACLAVIEKEVGKAEADVCAGHSLGEFSALNAAGVIDREDTMRLVLRRGELMHREAQKHEGAMQAIVGLDIDAVNELVSEGRKSGVVSVANHNTARQIVITGAPPAVQQVAKAAAARGAKAVPLKVSGAWHSQLIRGAESVFAAFLETISFDTPQRSVIFNVTADHCDHPDDIRNIMGRQLCSPVRWYDSMLKMGESGVDRYIEIGPGRVLTGMLRKILPRGGDARMFNLGNLKQLEVLLKEF